MMQSARAIAQRIADGTSSAEAELSATHGRIEEAEPRIAAFASRPERLAAGQGPLAGIACGVKDIIDTAVLPTRMGSPIYEGWRPRADAPIVMALAAAGATVAGKTHTTAFAFLDPAPTRNPHASGASPGGSSAGSAAAVAAGMIPLAIGTQTGGSVIRPAAYCGVAAIKPSFGLLPTVGVKPFSWSLDTLGLMAARVDDLGFALAAISRRPDLDAAPAAAKGLRIALSRQEFAGAADAAAEDALLLAADALREGGASVSWIEMPDPLWRAFSAHGPLQDHEAVQALAWELARHADALPPKLRSYLETARETGPDAYDAARAAARAGRSAASTLFERFDAVLTYSAPGEAPAWMVSTGESTFNRLWTLLGTPCVTVPVMRGPQGLPLGAQIVTRFGADARAIAIGRLLEDLLQRP